MSLCAARRFAINTKPLTLATTVRFSQCAKRPDRKTEPSEHKSETPDPPSEGQNQHDDRSQSGKKKGFGLPAFALFAVGAPLGWYLNNQYSRRHRSYADPRRFVKYTLIGKESVSSTCAIFTLKPSTNTPIDLCDPVFERAVTSVEFKQPQLQIARSYTCLPQEKGQNEDELRFLIRREQKGEVSNFLHRLPNGAQIEVRGLHAEYILPEDLKGALFLVGGTGIAPAMQAADILDGQADIHILWASRKREDCIGGINDTAPAKSSASWWSGSSLFRPADSDRDIAHAEKGALVTMLESLKTRSQLDANRASRLSVDYYVDEEGMAIKPEEVKHAINTLTRKGMDGRRILFVSGPEGFISYWAGSKQWANGKEVQGPLRGVLSTMDLAGWEVVKL